MAVSMERWRGKVALVTGVSSGIGAAIVETLVKEGLKVVGLARRKERLDEMTKTLQGQPGKFYPYKADVTKENEIIDAFKWTNENVGPVHILINNAGVVRNTNLTEGETQKWKVVLETNVMGLCIATREAVKQMRENKTDGHVIHINSVAGHRVPMLPNMSVYPASKHAVTALTETLRQELNSIGSKIKITSISPGACRTEMGRAGGVETEEMKKILATVPFLEPNDIADAAVYVLSTPPHVQVHELLIQPLGARF